MDEYDKQLLDIFFKAQAEPTGRLFTENVLAGLKAVIAHALSHQVSVPPSPDRCPHDVWNGDYCWACNEGKQASEKPTA